MDQIIGAISYISLALLAVFSALFFHQITDFKVLDKMKDLASKNKPIAIAFNVIILSGIGALQLMPEWFSYVFAYVIGTIFFYSVFGTKIGGTK